MSTGPVEMLKTLLGREPSADEVERIYKIKDGLGLADHDSLWQILVAFGQYEILFGEVPNKIKDQTQATLADHKLALEATAGAVERATKASLSEAIVRAAKEASQAARQATEQEAKREKVFRNSFIVAISVAIAIAGLTIAGYVGFRVGTTARSADEVWLASPEGRAAKSLAQLNTMQAMLDCSSSFAERREVTDSGESRVYCVPFDANVKRRWGWRIR